MGAKRFLPVMTTEIKKVLQIAQPCEGEASVLWEGIIQPNAQFVMLLLKMFEEWIQPQ